MSIDYPKPILTVDIVPLTLLDDRLALLRQVRENEPFEGRAALIGGYAHIDKDGHLGETARRVLQDKAGLGDLYIEQLSTFSGVERDPRGWSVSVAYFSLSPLATLEPALSRERLELVPVDEAQAMPFDHDLILSAALERLRGKGAYSDLPARLLSPEFSLAELHHVYQIALDEQINIDAFRRKAFERGFLQETGKKRCDPGANRPSALYRLKSGYSVFDRRL